MPAAAIIGGIASIGGSLLAGGAKKRGIGRAQLYAREGYGDALTSAKNLYTGDITRQQNIYQDSARRMGDLYRSGIGDVREGYRDALGVLSPYQERGNLAGEGIMGLLGYGDTGQSEAAFDRWRESSPYQFAFDEGMAGLNARAGAGGFLDSTASEENAVGFGQGLARQTLADYMGYMGNQQNIGYGAAGQMAGLSAQRGGALAGYRQDYGTNRATLGQNYAAARTGAAQNFSNLRSNLYTGRASELGSGALARGQANANMWGGVFSGLGQLGGGIFG